MNLKLCADCVNLCASPDTMLEHKKGICDCCKEEGTTVFIVEEAMVLR